MSIYIHDMAPGKLITPMTSNGILSTLMPSYVYILYCPMSLYMHNMALEKLITPVDLTGVFETLARIIDSLVAKPGLPSTLLPSHVYIPLLYLPNEHIYT